MSQREILRLFERALELPEDEREALLRSAPEHRAELEALLAKEREGDEFPRLAIPTRAMEGLGLVSAELRAGTRIGSFCIERLLASGGMGRVHLAVQENPHREVALKTLRNGLDSPDAFRRFRTESELLGRLRHPGIAQVYEAGVESVTTDGNEIDLPYIAMELVEGARSVVEHATAKGLDLAARLHLIADAAIATQHAHQKGVIHRDLKPSNIVVDGENRLRVIDFGIARALELERGDAPATKAGNALGTPAYMSPEQLTLRSDELDTRVDVYALGAVLYELVCGRPPFDTGDVPIGALAKQITDLGPARPRSVDAAIPGDVEAIVMKALAREREERYPSAAALADDLERYLRNEAIEARRPSLTHQVRLFARRNRLFAASLIVALVSLASAATISIASALEARRAEKRELAARDQVDEYLQNALDTNFNIVFEFADALAWLEGSTQMRAALLRSTMLQLDKLEDGARREPRNVAKLAHAYVQLGDALGAMDKANVGDLEAAAQAYARAEDLLADVDEREPTRWRTRMEVEEALGDQDRMAGDFEAALVHYDLGLEIALAERAENPEDEELHKHVLRRLRDVGNTHGSMGNHERALELFEEARQGLEELLNAAPDDAVLRYRYANGLANLGSATCNAIAPEDSLPLFREALARLEDLLVDAPGYRAATSALIGIRHSSTEALIRAGRLDEAIVETGTGLALADELLSSDPSDVQVRRYRGLLLYNAGWAYQERAERGAELDAAGAQTEQDLRAAQRCFQECDQLFVSLRDEGRLLPFEQDFFEQFEGRLEQVQASLNAEAEPGSPPPASRNR